MRVTGARGEGGFTLIELMVGLCLGAIVMAMIFGLVLDMFGAGERTAMDTKAQKAASHAADTLTSDVRAMRAPHREPEFTGSPDNLRTMILDNNNPSNYQIHDLLVAESKRIVFYAELFNSSPNAECVSWFVRPDGALQRQVRAYSPGCVGGGGQVRQESIIMPKPETARASAAAKVPDPFSFHLLAVQNPGNPNPATCTTPTRSGNPGLSPLERDQVTNIDLDLRSFVAGRTSSGDQHLKSSVTLSARQGMDYRYAIGCVA